MQALLHQEQDVRQTNCCGYCLHFLCVRQRFKLACPIRFPLFLWNEKQIFEVTQAIVKITQFL